MAVQRRPRTTASPITGESAASRTPATRRTEHRLLELPTDYEDEIRLRAYRLWEERGRRDGFAEEDWLEAEKEVLDRYKRPAA